MRTKTVRVSDDLGRVIETEAAADRVSESRWMRDALHDAIRLRGLFAVAIEEVPGLRARLEAHGVQLGDHEERIAALERSGRRRRR